MSTKIEINIVAGAMQKHAIDPEVMRAILEDLNREAEGDDTGAEKPPHIKKQFVIVISDPENRLPKTDFVGWVVQIPDSESPSTTVERIVRTAHDFNSSKRGRLLPVQTVGECIESAQARFFKENGVWVKSKTPVLVVKTTNEIRETPSLLSDADRGFTPAAS
jgi:hypothetical protein